MNFNKHLNLENKHAFLSPSKYHWVNYDEEKLCLAFANFTAAQRGTELHDFARRCIELGIRLPRNHKTLNMYVNDAIGFRLTPEQPLYFSDNCFGTADAIGFDQRNRIVRISDLKTGVTTASMTQLYVYAALFCLEYDIRPGDVNFELRLYQSDQMFMETPTAEDILPIMDIIVRFDKRIEKMKAEEI